MNNKRSACALTCLLLISFVWSGCLKDSVQQSYTYTLYRPVYKTVASVRADIKSDAPTEVKQPGKLFIRGNYIFLNEVDKGIHVIDNSNPAQPKNVAFIAIPGNMDLAVNGNTLYADLYTDLVAIDITNPTAVRLENVVEGVFPHRAYYNYFGIDTSLIVVDWITKDTTITQEYDAAAWKRNGQGGAILLADAFNRNFAMAQSALPGAAKNSSGGQGGSMARFTILGQRLYTVGLEELKTFNISNPEVPQFVSDTRIGFGIETIFPFKGRLFIGSSTGMFIYNTSNPDQPQQLSQFTHVQSCDPVIADDDHAYVTLRSGTACNGFTNQLEVLDIANLQQPQLVKTYPMTHPHGLSKDGNLLFICDGTDGLKLYDATAPDDLQLLKTITGMETYDVIAYNGLALVVAKDGLYQFDYADRNNIRQLSKFTLSN
jgi:hypothetical protein